MANQLTGDYDVVVQMGVPRIHGILAAQHQVGIFPHSFTVSLEGAAFGLARPSPIDPSRVVQAPVENVRATRIVSRPSRMPSLGGGPIGDFARFASDEADLAIFIGSRAVVPANLARFAAWKIDQLDGIARVQASTPTVTLAMVGSTARVTLHFDVRAHVLLAAGSIPLPEFVHGDVAISVDIGQLAFQRGTQFVLDFDFLAGNLEVKFTPAAGTQVSPNDVTTIENAVASLMAGGFVCGSTVVDVPAAVHDMQFRLLPAGPLPTAALVLNLSQHGVPSSPSSVNATFVSPNDGFALAIGRDFIAGRLRSAVDAAVEQALGPSKSLGFSVALIDYTVSILGADVEFHKDRFVLVLSARADRQSGWALLAPSQIDLTVRQGFRLYLVQGSVRVAYDGDPEIVMSDFLCKDQAIGAITSAINGYRPQFLDPAATEVQKALATLNLADVLVDLQVPSPTTEYNAVEVTTEGVILRGALTLAAREKPTASSQSALRPIGGQQHVRVDAFASWIPGGTVQSYTWVGGPRVSEEHRFVHDEPTADATVPGRWCVKVAGLQTTETGSAVKVSRWSCIPWTVLVGLLPGMLDAPRRDRHAVLVPRIGPDPVPDVWVDPWGAGLTSAGAGVNLIVHFAEESAPAALRALREAAARGSSGPGSVYAIVVLPRGQLARFREHERDEGTNGNGALLVSLTEDVEGTWARTFDASERPATYLVGPLGHVRWHRTGRVDPDELAAVLREHAVRDGRPRYHPMPLAVSQGDRAPDFRFELEPGIDVPLRRLRRQPVTLVFWTSWATGSLEELRRLDREAAEAGDAPSLVLAINDGEDPDHGREVFRRLEVGARFVADPERAIAAAYGVHCWPTTISIEGHGRVWNVEMGGGGHHDDDEPRAAAAISGRGSAAR